MDTDLWLLSEGTIDGLLALIRVREILPEAVSPASHAKLLNIAWNYENDGVSGMPAAEESAEMAEFENLIVPALEQDHACVLFAVETHDGQRYWRFYCRDKEAAQAAITGALGPEGDLPIDFEMADDPEWSTLCEILEDTDRAQ